MERLLRHTGPDGLLTENGLRLAKLAGPDDLEGWLAEALKRGGAPLRARWAQARRLGLAGAQFVNAVRDTGRFTPPDVAGWPDEEQPRAGEAVLRRWLVTADFVEDTLRADTGLDGLLTHPVELLARWNDGVEWSTGVEFWVTWTMMQSSPDLLKLYRLAKMLAPGTDWKTAVAWCVTVYGNYTVAGVASTWPPAEEPLARDHILEKLADAEQTAEAAAPPAKRPRTASTWELRSGARAQNLELASKAVVDWTSSQYQATQDFLRGNRKAEFNDAAGTRRAHADALKEHFQKFAAAAPRGAKSGVRYLYRGVHGPQADEIEAHGGRAEKGFVAFSWDRDVAHQFARGRLLLRLAVRDVPAGTPWIWFGRRNNPESLAAHEREVLLPPGRLTGVGAAAEGAVEVLVVRYAPAPWW